MKCTVCGTEMKPLAFSVYCPNDCDRIVAESIETEKTPQFKKPNLNGDSFPIPADGEIDYDDEVDWVSIFGPMGSSTDLCTTITVKFKIEL